MLDQIRSQKLCTRTKVIDRPKRIKTLNEANTNKNTESFLEINPVQKEAPPSHKLQGHAYE